jgi:IS4 transposase
MQTETSKVPAFKIAISVVLLNCLVLLTYLIQ